jgi:hypothetical protein
MTATTEELAGRNCTWQLRLAGCILPRGMPRNMWDVFVMQVTVVFLVSCKSARLVLTPCKATATRLVETALGEAFVTTRMVFVIVSMDSWDHVVRKCLFLCNVWDSIVLFVALILVCYTGLASLLVV